jgi:hypothetical protein
LRIRCSGKMFTEPLPRNCSGTLAHLRCLILFKQIPFFLIISSFLSQSERINLQSSLRNTILPLSTFNLIFSLRISLDLLSWHNFYLANVLKFHIRVDNNYGCRSEWPRGLRYELSSPVRTLGSWVRIPLKACMSMCAFILCLCCSVCRQRPCDGLIPRPRSTTDCV